eukprot:COSAG04_NODE_847_length_9903_cov_17.092411_4_plen_33_part_00
MVSPVSVCTHTHSWGITHQDPNSRQHAKRSFV